MEISNFITATLPVNLDLIQSKMTVITSDKRVTDLNVDKP